MSLTPVKVGRSTPSPAKSPLQSPKQKQKLTLPELSRTRQGLRTALAKCLEAAMHRLDNIWTDIGLDEEKKCARTKVVFEHMQTLLDDMATEEERCRSELRASMQQHLDDCVKLSAELHVDMIPIDEESTLLEKEQTVRSRCGELSKEKHGRVKRMKTYHADEEQLCNSLCRPRSLPAVASDACPTLVQLDEWQEVVDGLAREQKKRLKDLVATRQRLEDLWNELEVGPSTEFEEQLVNASTDKLQLTDSTQSQAERLCSEGEVRLAEHTQVADDLRVCLVPLWDRLRVEQGDRADFMAGHQGCRPSVIKSLRTELERLEEIRRENIGAFVLSVRQELHLLWDQCQFGSQQRRKFHPAFTEEFTEELLVLHEEELARLKAYVVENAGVYQLVERRDRLWTRLQEIVGNANNPDRLSNRGGCLLKEEKMRKQISKELPKVEKELRAAVQQWEAVQQVSFLINDARYLDSIENQWDDHEQRKQAEKDKRLQAKKATVDDQAKYGSKTPAGAGKRKNAATSAAPASKRPKTAPASSSRRPLASANATGPGAMPMGGMPRTPVKPALRGPTSLRSAGNAENCPRSARGT